ncbi:MAG: TlpA family protein disulfide reductase [Elusimicrobia bacterium]|nr:TlpA family protein disulfide reductase [Elusimicrobiota bacterium]
MFYKKLFILLLFVIACVSLSCAEVSYDFTLQDLEGKPVSLSDYKGKVVFIDFWATWCPPCRASIPAVENLYEQYKDNEDFVVLGINLQEDKDTILKFMKKQKMNYPVLLSDKKVISNYKISSIPRFFIIDKNGEIYNKYVGFAPGVEELWQKDIKKLL